MVYLLMIEFDKKDRIFNIKKFNLLVYLVGYLSIKEFL